MHIVNVNPCHDEYELKQENNDHEPQGTKATFLFRLTHLHPVSS